MRMKGKMIHQTHSYLQSPSYISETTGCWAFGLCTCFWQDVNVKTIDEFAEAVTFLICVGYVPRYVLCCETGYLRTFSMIFLSFVWVNTGIVLQLCLDRFLSCCVLSIMHRSSWHSTLYFDVLTSSLDNNFFLMNRHPLVGLGLLYEVLRSHWRHTTLGRTPLGEWPVRGRDFFLQYTTLTRQTSVSPARF